MASRSERPRRDSRARVGLRRAAALDLRGRPHLLASLGGHLGARPARRRLQTPGARKRPPAAGLDFVVDSRPCFSLAPCGRGTARAASRVRGAAPPTRAATTTTLPSSFPFYFNDSK